MKPNPKYDHAFAIVRLDHTDSTLEVTVKKIVWDADIAEKEVVRLNKINKNCLYFYQITRVERK